MNNKTALTNFFSFELDGQQIGAYHELQGLKWSCDTVTMDAMNSQMRPIQRVVPGKYNRPAELVFKTYSVDEKLWMWFDKALTMGAAGMRNGSIKFLDTAYKPMATYEFTNGWPSKLSWSSLTASSSAAVEIEVTVQVETLTLRA